MLKFLLSFLILATSIVMFAQNIYIGIYVNDIDMSTNIKYNIKGGVRIDSVLENSPASKAGLKKDHIIWKIDNQLVTNEEEFQKALSKYKPNDKVLFTVKNNHRTQVHTVNLQNRNTLLQDLYIYNFIQNPWLFIGFDVQKLDSQLAAHFNQKNGLLIVDVRDHSLALTNGFKVGDIITYVNKVPVNKEEELSRQLALGITKQPISVDVVRDNKQMKINLNLTNNKVLNFQDQLDAVYIIGPDIFDNELYIYSQTKIDHILKQTDSEIEQEIQRLESEIQGLKRKIKKK